MTLQDGFAALSQRGTVQIDAAAATTQIQGAAARVAARAPGVDQSHAVDDIGSELADYVAELQAQPAFQPFVAEGGWTVKLADLSKVCAFQPVVLTDHAEERAAPAAVGDMASLAKVTLPIGRTLEKPTAHFDPASRAWIVSSRNPNFEILEGGMAEVQSPDGRTATLYGFIIAARISFVQVVKYRGRFLLRDGYHRAFGLLARGMTTVPVLYREFPDHGGLGEPAGMLAPAAYMGERPPLLSDYLNDEVSVAVQQPASQKMIVMSGLQLSPLG